jgi:Cdc6-like AAA superfamily ATPase
MTPLDEIRSLYFNAKRSTIQKDIRRAIDLLRSMSSDADRQKAAVFMDGLSQMRSEWAQGKHEPD